MINALLKRVYTKLAYSFYDKQIIQDVYYIGVTEMMPPPLSSEEELHYLQLLHHDDGSAANVLIEHNLRLVAFIARKFDNTGISMDDLVSIGAMGLVKAVNSFDLTKNIKLATYAARCIENEILMYLRRACKYKAEVSLDEPLNVDWEGNELLLSDVLGTDGDIITQELERESDCRLLHEAIDRLKPREKQIIELRYGLNGHKELTQKEVADLLGISQSYISRLEKRILGILKREMA